MNYNKIFQTIIKNIVIVLLSIFPLLSCSWNLGIVDYSPLLKDDWEISTPVDQSLNQSKVDEFYFNAAKHETIEGLLVIKNDKLIAEKYFNGGDIDDKTTIQSATKSFTSALVGIAIEQGYIDNVDQKMMDYFPELVDKIQDTRKFDITIKQLLQMRAGYTWEESSDELFEILYSGFRPSHIVDFPLYADPGTSMWYSNLSSHILAIIVSRAVNSDLKIYAEENLFIPLGIEIDQWTTDWEGYRLGSGELYLTGRDMAKFGLLYLNDGKFNDEQVISKEWVEESFKTYSHDAWEYRVGKNFKDIGYGYQWWSASSGDYRYNMAWGHGGQLIFVVDDLNMVIVVKADPMYGDHGGKSWRYEKGCINLVANFISSL